MEAGFENLDGRCFPDDPIQPPEVAQSRVDELRESAEESKSGVV